MPITAALPAIAGIAGAGSSLLGGLMGSSASTKAAQIQAQSQAQALALEQSMFNTGEQNYLQAQQYAKDTLSPFTNIGLGAYNNLANLYGIPYNNGQGTSAGGQSVMDAAQKNFTNTPDYQFALDQGQQAVSRYLASTGQSQSGGAQKAISEFGQGLASQQFSNYFNRLLGLTQIGQQTGQTLASGVLGAANQNLNSTIAAAGQLGGTTSAIGATNAAGVLGSTQSLVNGLNGVGSNLQQTALLSRFGLGAAPTATPTTPTSGQVASPLSGYALENFPVPPGGFTF